MKYKKIICPICEEGNLNSIIGKEQQIYKNITRDLDFHYSECDCCESETATPAQIRQNKREMIKFQKDVDGLLSAVEIKALRLSLGLTIKLAGELFGGGAVAFSKYENDDLIHSLPMDSALRLALIHPTSIYDLAKARNIQLPIRAEQQLSSIFIQLVENSPVTEPISYQSELNTIPINFDNSSLNKNFVEVYHCVQ